MRKSRLSLYKQSRLIELFIAGTTARTAASLVGVNKTTASYFGGRRKNKRGRGAAGKVPVFGLLKRNGKVYTVVISDAKTDTLIPIIHQKVKPDSIVYTDTWRGYNALDVSEFKHYRINHSELFANKTNHINGIENFRNQAKRHMRKFNGIPRESFHLFLKECEWRFNNSDPKKQLKELNQWVKDELN